VRIEQFRVGPWENNLYLLTRDDGPDAIVVDPSMESEAVLQEILARGLFVRRILLTHAHIDHILMARRFQEMTAAPVWLHAGDRWIYERGEQTASSFGLPWPGAPPIAHWIEEGEDVGLPGIEARAHSTPGHSPGSVTFETEAGLLVGDVLFAGSVGRTDLPGGDWDTLVASVRDVLFAFNDGTRVCPGHGPETTIGQERRMNPFVGDRVVGLEG
jgi:glyoxylase-like metal-dependent hydrolase (beta-lactamase superfamily II)